MKKFRVLSVFVMCAVLITATVPASMAGELNLNRHVVGSIQLHKTTQDSSKKTSDARGFVNAFIEKTEVAAKLKTYGQDVAEVKNRVAMLSDSEILFLQNQIMAAELGQETVGGLTKAGKILTFIGIPVLALGIIMIAAGGDNDDLSAGDIAIDWKTTGYIWTGIGAVLTVVGLTRHD